MEFLEGSIGYPGLIAFALWSLAAWGLARAIFRSYWGSSVLAKLDLYGRSRVDEMKRAQWELENGLIWNRDLARNIDDPHAARVKLSAEAVAIRRAALAQQARLTIWLRLARYGLTCVFCQTFWVSLGLLLIANGFSWRAIPTAAAYAAAAIWFDGRLGGAPATAQGGGSCGKG